MNFVSRKSGSLAALALLALAAPGVATAQQSAPEGDVMTTVYGQAPADLAGLPEGPEIEGQIIARAGNRMEVLGTDGVRTMITLSQATDIKASGGFLGLGRTALDEGSLLNGLPVTVETVQWGDGLIASEVRLRGKDLKVASMIRSGTSQRFEQQGAAIEENAAATEALRGRMGDIDKYNIKGTTNVYFDTGKWNLSDDARQNLCRAASEAEAMDNALLLVVGYTDSVGSQDYNQVLSERRAGRVVNFLQQECGWKPWRMLTPTGMAEADPAADNTTAYGKAQNRRVAVNILVSKSVDGM
ncbi:OmpA family protein [Erythrobacter sp. HKB08]|uniref:OmpA family protein n=1 Tax=Erythrobacter sp. HKB08 TaxID=2502843 RepID=UPI00100915B2|nr:OmpA family protein [Erythrobacter sp. HKB08]